ncbi:MAG: copper amine oxidase N-terminal domain-containing protein [Solirubrobacterales bacterium]
MNGTTKWVLVSLGVLFAILFSSACFAAGSVYVTVTLDGTELVFPDQLAYIQNGRTYIPVRSVAQSLEANVVWNAKDAAAIIRKGKSTIIMPVGSKNPLVDGVAKPLDAPALLMNGRVMVPLRFISEILGLQVQWDPTTRTVALAKTVPTIAPSGTASTPDTAALSSQTGNAAKSNAGPAGTSGPNPVFAGPNPNLVLPSGAPREFSELAKVVELDGTTVTADFMADRNGLFQVVSSQDEQVFLLCVNRLNSPGDQDTLRKVLKVFCSTDYEKAFQMLLKAYTEGQNGNSAYLASETLNQRKCECYPWDQAAAIKIAY